MNNCMERSVCSKTLSHGGSTDLFFQSFGTRRERQTIKMKGKQRWKNGSLFKIHNVIYYSLDCHQSGIKSLAL